MLPFFLNYGPDVEAQSILKGLLTLEPQRSTFGENLEGFVGRF
jgi:hypothetical protein